MAEKSLRVRRAAIILDEYRGQEPRTREIRDRFKAEGLVGIDAQDIDQIELNQTRDLMRAVREFESPKGNGRRAGMISLFKYLPDGTREDYWKHPDECDIDQALQHLDYWHHQDMRAIKTWHEFYAMFCRMFGKRAIDRRLTYDAPKFPFLDADAG